jgi:uncharacterized membrane protein
VAGLSFEDDMANDYYNNTLNPPFLSPATSASVRDQFKDLKAAFDLLPTKASIYDGKVSFGTCAGSAGAYVVTTQKGVTALAAGAAIGFLPNHANTGAATVNVDTLGVKAIVTADGYPVSLGDLTTSCVVALVYNGTHWRQVHGSSNVTKAYIDAAVAAGAPPGSINFQQLGIGLATAYDQVQVNAAGTALEAVALTASRALVTDANGGLAASTATATEVGYLGGATSAIQTQLNALVAADKIPYVARSSNTIWAAADQGKYFDCTAAFTQTITAAATLGDGWWCIVRNTAATPVTLNPDGAETIDGVASDAFPILPQETRLIVCDGSNFKTVVLSPFYQEFTTAGAQTFTKPLSGYSRIGGLLRGGGGGGANANSLANSAGGGGGGACVPISVPVAMLDASETLTVAAGGAGKAAGSAGSGAVGGNTVLNVASGYTAITAYGGGGGSHAANASDAGGGGGGGALSVGLGGTSPYGGQPRTDLGINNHGYGGGQGAYPLGSTIGGHSAYGGGGGAGAGGGASAGNSVYGGAGGGSVYNSLLVVPGTSIFGGNGGAGHATAGVAGSQPGGGGGGTGAGVGGAGGDGKAILWGIV